MVKRIKSLNFEPNQGNPRRTRAVHGSGRSPGEGKCNPLQYSCLENPMGRGAWWATVHGVAKNQTQLKQLSSSKYIRVCTPT